MMSVYTVSGAAPYLHAENRFGVLRDAAVKAFYFTLIATAFAFVLILTAGPHL
jgi:hypothetical protein